MKTAKIYIQGRVQGIFFRAFVEKEAKDLKLKGFTRNLEDGRIEVVVEGEDNNVNKMIEKCKVGPRHSEVRGVEVEYISNQGFDSFKVLNM